VRPEGGQDGQDEQSGQDGAGDFDGGAHGAGFWQPTGVGSMPVLCGVAVWRSGDEALL
jgi:hypothetical protein